MAPPPPSPSPRRRRHLLLFGLGVLLLISAGLWQRHTVLRWLVEETLAHVLRAEVRLESLHHPGQHHWRLENLEILAPGVEPRLRSAQFPQIDLQLPWSALRQGIFPDVIVQGGRLHLDLRAEPPPDGDPPPKVKRLRLVDLQLSWARGDDDSGGEGQSVQLNADLSHPMTQPRGEARLQAPWLDLGVLARALLGQDLDEVAGRQSALGLHILWTDAGPELRLTGGTVEWQLAEASGRVEPWSLTFDPRAAQFQLALGPLSVQRDGQSWQEDTLIIDGQATPPSADGAHGWRLQAATTGRWFERARWTAAWDPSRSFLATDLELQDWRWHLPDGAIAILDSRLAWQDGQWDAETVLHALDRSSHFQNLVLRRTRLPLRVQFSGHLRSDAGDTPTGASWLDGTVTLESAEDLRLLARGAWHLLDSPPRINVALEGSDLSLTALQEMLTVPLLPAPWQGDGNIALVGPLQGPVTSPHGRLSLQVPKASVQSTEVEIQLDSASAEIRLLEESPWPTVHWDQVTAQGTLRGPSPLEARFDLDGSFQLDENQTVQRLDLERLDLDAGPLGQLQGSGEWQIEAAQPRAQSQWTLSEVDLAALLPYLPNASPNVFAGGNAVQGRLGGDWALSLDANRGFLTFQGPFTLENLGYASEDGSRVVEGGGLRLQSSLSLHEDGTWNALLDGEVDGFLLLWDTFFGDFESWRSQLAFKAEGTAPWPLMAPSEAPPIALGSLTSSLSWPEGPLLEMTLRPDTSGPDTSGPDDSGPETWHVDANLSSSDLASLHGRYLASSFGDAVGQQLEGRFELKAEAWIATDSVRTEGQLVLQDAKWTQLAGTSMDGLQLTLPFGLMPPDGSALGPVRPGTLRFQAATAGGFKLPETDTALWTEGDALGLVEALELPLYGGRVALRELQVRDLLDQPRLRAALQLDALDLGAMSKELGIPALEGQLDGELARVDITQQELRVDGGGRLALFGGHVDIGAISGSEIFTPFPRIELSADLSDIDLGQLTQRLDFGEMHGTLQGSIQGCSLFRGIPVTCRARFETVQRPGVRRSVDVKAVNNLTVLGTGARTNVFDRGIQRLFNRFTYDRFGASIDLANDSLLLQGLERRGEKELFMSGRLPFPIDIVNAQPGRRVSFQAMLDRLENLDFEGVTTTAPPP